MSDPKKLVPMFAGDGFTDAILRFADENPDNKGAQSLAAAIRNPRKDVKVHKVKVRNDAKKNLD